jgi:hypothetical protein
MLNYGVFIWGLQTPYLNVGHSFDGLIASGQGIADLRSHRIEHNSV